MGAKRRPSLVPDNVQGPGKERVLFVVFWTLFFVYSFVILFDRLYLPRKWCPYSNDERSLQLYPNPDSKANDPCYYHRSAYLLGMNQFECDFSRRIFSSILYGAAIGFERKAADRPAGIRTMSLVCLGACIFTMCGQFAFRASPQTWDAARVSAAVPSGVGFLGSALIWKQSSGPKNSLEEKHQVRGITTAASIWLAASVGIAAGGEHYLYSAWAVILVVFILRLGPRMAMVDDGSTSGIGSTDGATSETSDWETAEEDNAKKDNKHEDNQQREAETNDTGGDDDEAVPLTREQQLEMIRKEAAASKEDGEAQEGRRVRILDASLTASQRRRKERGPAVSFLS